MTNIEIIQTLLEKYQFVTPISPESQKKMEISKRKNLIAILKKMGRYGIIIAAALKLFFFVKRMGFSISFMKAYVLTIVIGSILVGSFTASSILLINKFYYYSVQLKFDKFEAENRLTTFQLKEEKIDNSIIKPSYTLLIKPIQSNDELKITSEKMRHALLNNFNKVKGNNFAYTNDELNTKAPLVLSGSIVKLGRKRVINLRLIQINNSQAVYALSEELKENSDINTTANKIVKEIAENIK